ncbi:MAG: FIST N-terminal domain-containing protein [Polyangiaceae bacterium]
MTKIATKRAKFEELGRLEDELFRDLDDAPPVLVVVFASSKTPFAEVMQKLEQRFQGATVIGSTTAGEFTEDGDGQGTVTVFGLAGDYRACAGLGMGLASDPEGAVHRAIEGLPTSQEGYDHKTGIVLLDPLAGHGEEAALLLAGELGDSPLVGGAAGDDLAMTKTLVAAAGKVSSDAIVAATIFSRVPLGIGVKHGHTALSQPLKVTRADGSVVLEIDGRPAWEVWLENTRQRAHELGLDAEANAGAYLLRFEAGLRVGHEYKVRAPLAPKPGGGILFATPLPEGTVFSIMESDASAQVDSAVAAATIARTTLGGREVAGALVFDCICRKLILEDGYGPMLEKVSEALGGAPLAGFETYGEIAMNSGDMSGFHNTTSVVLAFPR